MTDNKTQPEAEGENATPAEDIENENSAESSTEKTTDDQTQSQEGEQTPAEDEEEDDKGSEKGNLADHPRWQKREEDWNKRFNNQETRHTDEMNKLREDFIEKHGKSDAKTEAKSEIPLIPAWFGGDESQWASYLKDQAESESRAEKKAIAHFTQQKTDELKAIDEATVYMNKQIEEIESDKKLNPSGAKIDRNKLLKFVLDNDLADTKGRWNYKAAHQMMRSKVVSKKTDSTAERKKIAGATTGDKHSETTPSKVTTSADFAKPGARPW